MIRKLRLKFVAVCMAMVTAVLAVVFMSVYFSVQRRFSSGSFRKLIRATGKESSVRTSALPSAATGSCCPISRWKCGATMPM